MEYESNEQIYADLFEQIHTLHKENARLMQELERSRKYADDLVEHSNMPCLPADLRNLRQTNEHLAVENEKLNAQVKELNRKLKSIQAIFL
jgi:polyhydroxyalkanoate synthesis regulator phasin